MLAVISEFAPAKVNLALHVTGRRADCYHLLDSLVVFADIGDLVRVEAADHRSLTIDGPFADGLAADASNLVLRAASAFGAERGAKINLTKNLPVASGIGGGSADAAAALRALSRLWDRPMPDPVALGADVPVCVSLRATRMRGIGDVLEPVQTLPSMFVVLANPGVAVSTADVFRELSHAGGEEIPAIPVGADATTFARWLKGCRNDLEVPACAICPAIAPLIAHIATQEGCLLARMSGSGATCFGLFATLSGAEQAARALKILRPDYWIKAVPILP